MDFDFSDDQEMLRDTVRKWVEKDYTFERRRTIVKAGGFSKEAWAGLADLGLLGLYVPEAQGGMGLGPIDAMVVMEELGRGIVMEPFAAVSLVAASLLTAGHAPSAALWLQGIAEGKEIVVLAHQERRARYRLAHVETTAKNVGGTWQLSGLKSVVPAGAHAGAFIVPARVSGAVDDAAGIALFLVSKGQKGVAVRGYPTQDGACAAELTLTDAGAIELLPAGPAFAALEHAIDIGIAALCAEAVGAMDKLVAVTVEYMNTRKQFGVAIASFQALKHRVADVKMQLELARSMSYFASLKLNEPAPARRYALAQAKLQLGQSMRFVGQQCIQLHGGIGVTDEYVASHYFTRLTVMEMTYGDSMHQLGEVSARMQDSAGVFA
ncbi:MAG: acyl-CoA dehydrogenase family protein [Rhizobacter sp.]|nr:acyl-CoA dehydrogenase family protein [Rhizobacter sp.]